jgi:hypothetical protein
MKKVLAAVLSVSMLAAPCAGLTSVFAEGENVPQMQDVSAMEQVLLTVKSRIGSTDQYTSFDSSTTVRSDGSISYHFIWSKEEEKEVLRVSADSKGNILSYYIYGNEDDREPNRLPEISREFALEQTDAFLKTLLPGRAEKLVLSSTSSAGNDYSFSYEHYEDGVPVHGDNVQVTVATAGEMFSVRSVYVEWTDGEYAVPQEQITKEAAAIAYQGVNAPELRYSKGRDGALYLEYALKGSAYIDAATGEERTIDLPGYEMYPGMNDMAGSGGSQESGKDALTPVEQEEADAVQGLMSSEALEAKIRSAVVLGIEDTQKLTTYQIYKSKDHYFASLRFASEDEKQVTNVRMDAKTGEVYFVSSYGDAAVDEKDVTVDEEAAKGAVNKFLSSYAPTNYAKAKLGSIETAGACAVLHYYQDINGIPYYGNQITVTYNAQTSRIESVYVLWEDVENVPSAEGVLTAQRAYEIFQRTGRFGLTYISSNKKPALVYTMLRSVHLDAKTGDVLNSWGEKNIDQSGQYSDLEGHWAQGIIQTMAENGIIIAAGEFKPDEQISQSTYLELLYKAVYRARDVREDDIYDYMVGQKIITKDEKNPEAAVTKQQALIYLLRMMGYRSAAEIPGIYVCDFADSGEISKQAFGYVAIAKGLGIIQGDGENKFNPTKEMTRAEAASVVYNYLTK